MKFKATRRRIGAKLKRFDNNLSRKCRCCGQSTLLRDLVMGNCPRCRALGVR